MTPDNARVDLAAVRELLGGTYVAVAARARAEELAGSVSGSVLPISYEPRLELIVDPSLCDIPEL